MRKKLTILSYIISWIITLLTISMILWFFHLSMPNERFLNNLLYFVTFFILQIILFRALIGTSRLTIEQLAFFTSKREKKEDKEFVLIIETLLLFISILINIILALTNFYVLDNPIATIINFNYAILGILTAALLNYTYPLIKDVIKQLNKSNKNSKIKTNKT